MKINKILTLVFLFITFSCLAEPMCTLPLEITASQEENFIKINEVKSVARVYFYAQPFDQCKKEVFVINNDRLISFKEFRGFDYVAYINKEGRTVNGWVKNSNLIEVVTPEKTISPRDYSVTMDGINIYLGQPIKKLTNEIYAKTGRKIVLTMIGNNDNSSVFGMDFPNNKYSSIYVSDINHLVRNNAEESVSQISIYSNMYSTSRDVRVGDDFNLVSVKYGNDGVVDIQKDGGKVLSFEYLDMMISFSFNTDNKVESIVYALLPWSTVVESLQCSHNILLLNRISEIRTCN